MSDLLKRKSAAIAAFTKIGKSNGSAPPDSTSNTFGIAYELAMADALRGVAGARYDAAKAAAIAAGLISEDYTPGTHVPYNADGLSIVVARNKDGEQLDKTMLKNHLSKRFGEKEADAIIDASSKTRKGAMKLSVSLEG